MKMLMKKKKIDAIGHSVEIPVLTNWRIPNKTLTAITREYFLKQRSMLSEEKKKMYQEPSFMISFILI